MLSSDENSGLFTFMLGLVVVVFTGIGLSIAVDRRFSLSASGSTLEAEVKSDGSELECLRETHRELSLRLAELGPNHSAATVALAAVQKRAADLEQRRKSLVSMRENLKNSIPAMEEEFVRYRGKYREAMRYAAIGTSLGTLTTLDGRKYPKAFIKRVTDTGMEIRHEHGSARFQASELDQSLRNRFQWSSEERQAVSKEDTAVQEPVADAPVMEQSENAVPEAAPPSADPAEIEALRRKVIAWRSRISQLRSAKNEALGAAYGSRKSPPGSLETWQARAGRLGNELAKAEAELAAAKAGLAVVSPHDALLRRDADAF